MTSAVQTNDDTLFCYARVTKHFYGQEVSVFDAPLADLEGCLYLKRLLNMNFSLLTAPKPLLEGDGTQKQD